jgi:hypothetical protein
MDRRTKWSKNGAFRISTETMSIANAKQKKAKYDKDFVV